MTAVLAVAAVWLAVATPAAVLIGRALAAADHQQEEVKPRHLTSV